MKHVVYIITKLELGGAQKVCLSLYKQMLPHATLISGTQGALVSQVQSPNTILIPEFTREVSLFRLDREIRTFFKLIGILRSLKKKYGPIMVHTHSTKAGLLGRWAAFFAGINTRVHTIHGYGFHEYQPLLIKYSGIFLEWITNYITTQYICVSSADVTTGIHLFTDFKNKHTIIRAAVDWNKFYIPAQKALPFPVHKPFVFGTIACFKKQKNLFDLLSAFKQAYDKNKDIRLELVGDGILRPEITAWIEQHMLSSVITLHGWKNDPETVMRHWHAFVLSSLWEGLPCAIVEARLMHLPIISYNTGGIADVVKDNYNGVLIQQQDVQGLADALYRISTDPYRYQVYQQASDQLEQFKQSVMVKQHIELYNNL